MKTPMQICLVAVLACSANIFADARSYEEVYADRVLSQVDKNINGQFEKSENEGEWKKYQKLDVNHDEVLTQDELTKADIQYLETGGDRRLNLLYKQAPEEDLFLDLYYPTAKRAEKCPVVFFIHGGGWAAGDKQGAANSLYGPLFKKLLGQGFCVAAVNYRLFKMGGTVYVPECVADCKDAMRYLSKNSKTLQVDPNRFFVIGGSSGGTPYEATG